ncbi:MAG TPA: polyprenyl diphosphate synthase [Acidimicrobiia bacterium]|nr:polyprenyl diphosphate synthase [Acidimicrobiia bacterium]
MTALDLSALDPTRVPFHVGMILDGNGRWANQRGLPRTAGHEAAERVLFECVEGAIEIGVGHLTAFTFSTENWSRSESEVAFLMGFNEALLLRRRDELHERGVRVTFCGDLTDRRVPDRNRELMEETERLTAGNGTMVMTFAFNYGARWEITRAVRSIAADVADGRLSPDDVTEQAISQRMELPDVDLIIRSSGEHRLSNFLLWQAAYAEFSFPGILFPDFSKEQLLEAVLDYQRRERRFGAAADVVDGR